MRPITIMVALALLSLTHGIQAETVVYTAKLIRTMEPALPEATAVAVEDGKVLAVGSLDSLSPLIAARGARIDRQFEDKVMTPGFIDPHVHPTLPAVLTQFPFLAPDDWYLPTGDFPERQRPRATEVHCKIWSRNMMMRQYRLLLLAITRCGTARCGGMISTTGLAIHPS